MVDLFIVGGTFNALGGKPSGLVDRMIGYLQCPAINGGTIEQLHNLNPLDYRTLLWMPNIDNSEDKILPSLKEKNPKLLLISSKRCVEKSYTDGDIVGRLLKSHSAMGIKIWQSEGSTHYKFKLLDPLGNVWCNTDQVEQLCAALKTRLGFLAGLQRVRSVSLGYNLPFSIEPEFIEQIKAFGSRFSEFINAVNPNRLLGNAATRCSYGFPSVRTGERIFVTRRNVDKATLGEDDFVEVQYCQDGSVGYRGNVKPSVDTPIQLRLFQHYPGVNYMMHGHVYVEGAPLTTHKIPCGYVEEVQEITELFEAPSYNFTVNLRGHGCLVLAKDLQYLEEVRGKLIGRPFPEGV